MQNVYISNTGGIKMDKADKKIRILSEVVAMPTKDLAKKIDRQNATVASEKKISLKGRLKAIKDSIVGCLKDKKEDKE